MLTRITIFLILILVSIACSEGPKSEDTMIDESLILDQETMQGRIYYVDSVKSFVSWTGSNQETSHYGIVHIRSGNLILKDSVIVGGEILIDMSKIEVLDLEDNAEDSLKLITFLNSKDMFNVNSYPVAKFVIDSVVVIPVTSKLPDLSRKDISVPEPNYIIFGKMTIKNVTRDLKFPARIEMRYYKLQSSANFDIARLNLGITGIDQAAVANDANQYTLPGTINLGFDIIAVAR